MGSNTDSARWRRSCLRARSSASLVAAGPADNSANVMDEIANSFGNASRGMRCRSMTTEVSSNPTANCLGTWLIALINEGVQIIAEALGIDGRCPSEYLQHSVGLNTTLSAQRPQLSHRLRVTRHDECLTFIKCPHDAAAVVPKFTLADDLAHLHSVAPRATPWEIQPPGSSPRSRSSFPSPAGLEGLHALRGGRTG